VPCPCIRDDYECNECYVLNDTTGDCVFNSDECDSPPTGPTEDPCVGYYYEPTAYRLVVGDNCNYDDPTSLKLLGKKVSCNPQSGSTAWFAILVVIFILFLLGAVFGFCIYYYQTNDRFRALVQEKLPAVPAAFEKLFTRSTGERNYNYNRLSTNIDEDSLAEDGPEATILPDDDIAKATSKDSGSS